MCTSEIHHISSTVSSVYAAYLFKSWDSDAKQTVITFVQCFPYPILVLPDIIPWLLKKDFPLFYQGLFVISRFFHSDWLSW